MQKKSGKLVKDSKRVLDMLTFMNLAFNDYLGARVLFNAGLPLQGSMMASTALEKYFKALLASRGNTSHGHLKQAHLRSVKHFAPDLYSTLNESFLLLLSKCYQLRYADAVKPGFNLVLSSRCLLAELDETVAKIEAMIIVGQSSQLVERAYQAHVTRKIPTLYTNNHVLGGVTKTDFIVANSDIIYEMRMCGPGQMIEATYQTQRGRYEPDFLRPGLTPAGERSMKLADEPMLPPLEESKEFSEA